MRRVALFFMICSVCVVPAQAEEETFVDDESALVVRIPAGWSQDQSREHGRIRFAGIRELVRAQYALFTVETGPAAGFDAQAWLDVEEAYARANLTVATPFETEPRFELGGRTGPHYSVAAEGPGYNVRIRAAAVVHGGRLYRVAEHSYNGAHTNAGEDLDRMWQGISFREDGADAFQDEDEGYDDSDEEDADDSGDEPAGLDLTPDEGAAGEKVEDKVGNFNLVLPAGWRVEHEPQDQPDVALRMIAVRGTAGAGDVAQVEIWRYTSARAETFTIDTPEDFLKTLYDENKWFEKFYGAGSAKVIIPDVDDGVQLGECEKSSAFVFSGIRLQEEEKISKAQKLRARGDKTVKVPEFKPIIVRGRLALLSPHIYLAVGSFRRDVGEREELVAEVNKIYDSFKFYQSEEIPPPLAVPGVGHIEDTTAAPENAKTRKGSHVHIAKGRKIYKLKVDFVLPPGFQRLEKGVGEDASLLVVAQDKANNWVKILVAHLNANALGERQRQYRSKKENYAEWKSNWESKARGVKMKDKPGKVVLGKVRGDGYAFVEGTVEKFRGTFTGLLFDKSGWRTYIEMETRGQGDQVFEKQIKEFFKRLKFKKIK